MWSHTIKSPAPKSTYPPAERPIRAGGSPKKKDDTVSPPEEDMMKSFDVDGFSKTSKVHASKKPLTVAKAPSFSRTTSRTGQTATNGTDPLRKDSQNKSTQSPKPIQTSRAGTPARITRTATPTQTSSKVGTPLKKKLPITSPKQAVSSRRLTSESTQGGVRSPSSEKATPAFDTIKSNEPGETPTNHDHKKDENSTNKPSREDHLRGNEELEESNHKMVVEDGEIQNLQTKIQDLQATKDAEIQELQAQIKGIQNTNEERNQEIEAAFRTQIASLESEIDDARMKTTNLEATHRKTQEESNGLLGLKDEEIRKLSQAANGRRREQEAKESALSLKGEFQKLQTQHKHDLDEAVAAASVKIEAVQSERDELIRSRDKEIKELGDLVQELQEKVERAQQADNDELEEARKRHDSDLRETVTEHERELQEANTKFEELQARVTQLEQTLRDAVSKHKQEIDDARKGGQLVLHDARQIYEQEARDMASKNQKEVEDLMLMHHEELKTVRKSNEQASEDSVAKYQQEIEALVSTQKQNLEAATARQEQALEDAATKYLAESKILETTHLQELRDATAKEGQASEALTARHQQDIEIITERHQEKLKEIMATNDRNSSHEAGKSRQAIEAIKAKHQEEFAIANSQIEELKTTIQTHQQDLNDAATSHEQDLERVAHDHQQELRVMSTKSEQELKSVVFDKEQCLREAAQKYKEFESLSLDNEQSLREAAEKYKELESVFSNKEQCFREAAQNYEKEAARLQIQMEIPADKITSLESTVRELHLQRENSGKEAAVKHEQELQAATQKYEEELQSLRSIYATAVEEITALKRTVQDAEQQQREAAEEELQSLRIIYATAVEEITALRRKVETLNQKRSKAIDEAVSLKTSLDDLSLKRDEAVLQLSSMQAIMKDVELERREAAVEIALLRDKLELADRRFQQDQQAVSDLQRQTRELQAQIAELSTDKNLDQTEAAVDAALFKDKLELADLEIHLHKGTISALQNEVERLQAQLAEESAEKKLDHNEAVVDVALLKDKLELADVQIGQAKGTVSDLQDEIEVLKAQITDSTVGMDLDQTEAAVEIALLKNTLEVTNLESHQNKATITALRKQIEGLQAQIADVPKPGPYTHHQLREELSMLERNHGAQMTDLDSLMSDTAAESKLREQEWKERADVWDRLASEMQGIKMHLVGTVGGSSRADE